MSSIKAATHPKPEWLSDTFLIVDPQPLFIGSDEALIPQIRDQAHQYRVVYATRFINLPGSLYRKALSWPEGAPEAPDAQLHLQIAEIPQLRVVTKTGYCPPEALWSEMAAAGIKQVHICGWNLDACVLAAAFSAWDAGIQPVVLADLCSSSWDGPPGWRETVLQLIDRQFGCVSEGVPLTEV